MDYNAPFGSADPNAAYVDRNTPGAVAGSKVPALAIEMPQREIVTVIKNAGLTPNKTDPTQLDQALDLKIAAVTGGGGDENYVLMTQARVRLPIFPEMETADGKLPVYSPANGAVRIPAGYHFIHRGIFQVTTVEQDFVTAANKTYHLRWSPSGGFALKDLADAAYNASALAEANNAFDTGFDDMLVSRVVTNASNAATITNLVNKDRISFSGDMQIESTSRSVGTWETSNTPVTLNSARRLNAATLYTIAIQDGSPSDEIDTGVVVLSRYQIGLFYRRNNVIGDGCRIGYTAWG